MKKYKLYSLGALALLLGATSCGDDFLSVEPSSSVSIDGYYTTNARIMESAVAAYDPMRWYDYYSGWANLSMVSDVMADDLYVGGSSVTDQGQLHLISQYRSDPNNSIGGAWSASYSGINRSIRLMDNAKASDLADADKNLYIAEGRALRSWYYLNLWKLWGNIPFYEENLSFPYIAEQLNANDVYAKMVADLEELLDSKIFPMKQPDEWAGRLTHAAIAMIYADYVMYQNDQSRYAKVLGYMKEIIDSNKYNLVADYDDLYLIDKEWNEEIILDVNYISRGSKRGWGSAESMMAGGTVYPAMIGVDGLQGAPDFQGGWGFGTVSKEAYDAFEAGDKRRDVAILNIDKYIKEKTAEGLNVTYGGRYQNTGFFLRKYLPRPGGTEGSLASSDLGWDNNLHLYRFAETLLNAAELALETGDAGYAKTCFDRVRERAGLPAIAVTKENIIKERRVEFVGEGKRYYDLVRSGQAASVLKPGGGVVLQNKETQTYGGQAIPERGQWTDNKKYLPIPQGEIEAANGTLIQNPY